MLLALDSSTAWAGVAPYDVGHPTVVDGRVWRSGTDHCAQLIPTIDDAMRRHGIARRDLEGVVVAIGPGTFNGVRVGVSTAKGIAAGLGVPIVGIETLAVYA